MKYIKYDEHGNPVSSREVKGVKVEPPSYMDGELNVVQPVIRKRTIRGAIIGIIIGIPLAGIVQIAYLFAAGRMVGSEVSADFTVGIVVFAVIVAISTVAGYISGSMADRE